MRSIELKDGRIATLRCVKKEDAQALIDYLKKISYESDFLTFGEGEINLTLEKEEMIIESSLKQDNSLFVVVEIDNKLIGNLNFAGGTKPRIKHTGEFGVSVLKDYWGLGIGTQLVSYLIDWCRDNGVIKKVNLRVRTDNSTGIAVYRNIGFKMEGTISRDFKINNVFYDSYHMGLEID